MSEINAMSTRQSTPSSAPALRTATGRDRAEWFAVLDGWGAPGRSYREIAGWLTREHGLSSWWAQKLIVEYQQDRGLRQPGARPDGTYAGGASKTIAATAERVLDAFADPALRARWLPGIELRERTSRPGRSARFDLADGSRLNATVTPQGVAKVQIAVEQERLPAAADAARAKEDWRQRLTALKALLES